MTKSSDAVKRWRENFKIRMIKAMGGQCQICGYKKCDRALALHHIDPSEKEFSFSGIRANPKAWSRIVPELKKCILLCHNCHSEIHDGIIELPKNYASFDENFVDYKDEKVIIHDECPICKKLKPSDYKTCSRVCAGVMNGRRNRKVDWDNIDLNILKKTMSNSDIARKLGVSETAIRKRLR